MRVAKGQVVYSPSDLVVYLESPFASWMDRRYLQSPDQLTPDADDPLLKVLATRGNAHELRYLEKLQAAGHDVCIVEGADRYQQTVRALADGREVIFQARLKAGQFAGHADFLRRVGSSGQGDYAVWDTKLSRHAKPYFLIQLCCYADMLEQMTGTRPDAIGVILGDGMEHSFRTSDFFAYYQRVRQAFLALMERFPEGEAPEPLPSASQGRWASHAQAWLEMRDHLCQIAGISKGQIAKFNGVGIHTMKQLADDCPPHVTGIGPAVLPRLQRQAQLQVASAGKERPLFEVLPPPADSPESGLAALPLASSLDVFFDMEGYPAAEDWLDYLFGAVEIVAGKPVFHDWWAHTESQEKRAFEAFIDWAYARWQQDPTMHIYHYAAYETTAAKRLMGKYGSREDKVDDLLRNKVFVDLYAVVRRGLLVGEPAYSIKNLEHLYMPRREGGVTDAGTSIAVYDAWCESGEPSDWRQSEKLQAIRDYNEDDCVSTWMLAEWLRQQQADACISWAGDADPEANDQPVREENDAAREARELAERLLATLPDEMPDDAAAAEQYRITQLLAYLVEFHRRAEKPMWWMLFERLEMNSHELWDDMDCLSGLSRSSPAEPIKQSMSFAYRFDADQDSKLTAGKVVKLVPDIGVKATISSFDPAGALTLKVSNKQLRGAGLSELPQQTAIVPYDHVPAGPLKESVKRVAESFMASGHLPPAAADFLARRPPRLMSGHTGELRGAGEDIVDAAIRVARDMDASCLCLQGPPGTGKTYTAAKVILALMADGKSVGISANSHAAILKLITTVLDGSDGSVLAKKVGGDESDPAFTDYIEQLSYCTTIDAQGKQPPDSLIGGTAWFFARVENVGAVDYLFIDEAGQVSVANLIAMAPATTNIVLLGDQMQLGQPIQGSHPGESGQSILEYYLHGHDTIPPDRGLFLDTSWRMHPDVCGFISAAVYEGRLQSEPHTVNRVVQLPARLPEAAIIRQEAGIVFVQVEHEGNSQASDEEVSTICAIVEELLSRTLTDKDGETTGKVSLADDILFVAPYNMQVRKLQKALPEGARVGSVDKFQGQEAPIVIVSLCASPGEFGSRGMQFVLDKNRLNVAISRAQSLAVVVGDPRLAESPCGSVEDMRLLNLCCWIQDVGG